MIARAVAIVRPGGPEVLRVIEQDVPDPGPGEVRIRVMAADVNPSDIAIRERGSDRSDPPWVPGWDAAGVVESVGAGVDRLAVGDKVMAVVLPALPGAQRELLVAPAGQVVPILPMNGLTAMRSLELLDLGVGDTLVVTGGAGQLASFAIPLAKERGLTVIADAKPDDEPLVRSFGADVVVPRGEGFVDAVREVVPQGADGLLDTALLYRDSFPAIRDGGVLVPVRGWSHGSSERNIDIRPVLVWEVIDRTDWLHELRRLASTGKLRLRVAGVYPPERAADAHRAMEAGGIRGRAVIVFA